MERYTMFLGGKNQHCQNDYTPKAIHRFNAIPIKLPMKISTKLKNFTISMETQNTPPKANAILRKKNGTGGMRLPDLRLYYKDIIIKRVWH